MTEPSSSSSARSSQAQRVLLSKKLSSLLRHRGPASLRPDGFAPLGDLARALRCSEDAVLEVATPVPGEKPRFQVSRDLDDDPHQLTWLRATHGHSDSRVQEELLHTPISEPLPLLVHGTHAKNVASILQGGLRSMGRRHVHFVDSDAREAVDLGFRGAADRMVYVDMAAAMAAGLHFFRAPDGMVVTPGKHGVVSPEFIKEVASREPSGALAEGAADALAMSVALPPQLQAAKSGLPFCDCHLHCWTHATHSWLHRLPRNHPVGDMSALRDSGFPIEQYLEEAASVQQLDFSRLLTVHVQGLYDAGDDLDETRWLAGLASFIGHPSAICAYVDLSQADASERLERHMQASQGRLRGVRQSLKGPHPEKPDLHTGPHLIEDATFRQNLGVLGDYNLVFELMVAPGDWERATTLVGQSPSVTFVINHCGLPFASDLELWHAGLEQLSSLPNVLLKLSGFAIFDNQWTLESVQTCVKACIGYFGIDRCMFALDFPVDRLRGSYEAWLQCYVDSVAEFGVDATQKLLFGNAVRAYRLAGR